MALNSVQIDLFDCHTNRQLQNCCCDDCCGHCLDRRLCVDRLCRNSSSSLGMEYVNGSLLSSLDNLEDPTNRNDKREEEEKKHNLNNDYIYKIGTI